MPNWKKSIPNRFDVRFLTRRNIATLDVINLDTNKIDDATLALLLLGLHDGFRAWKGFDWDAMERLPEAGNITNPRGKAKSVVFTEEGLERAERLLEELFGK